MSRIAQHCSVGPRENLEDTMSASTFFGPGGTDITLLVVCDGVGGEAHGEVASAIAVAQIQATLTAHLAGALDPAGRGEVNVNGVVEAVTQALRAANDVITDNANQEPELSGMATTAVCAAVLPDSLIVGWAGDSRCYRYGAGTLQQITRDHSELAELLALGEIHPEQALGHPAAHTVTRFLGQGPLFRPETCSAPIANGDLVILCTDGLTDVLSAANISRWVESYRRGAVTFDELPRELIHAAVRDGTTDNTTVLCYEHGLAAPLVPSLNDRTVTDGYALAVARLLHPQPRKEIPYECNTHQHR